MINEITIENESEANEETIPNIYILCMNPKFKPCI